MMLKYVIFSRNERSIDNLHSLRTRFTRYPPPPPPLSPSPMIGEADMRSKGEHVERTLPASKVKAGRGEQSWLCS